MNIVLKSLTAFLMCVQFVRPAVAQRTNQAVQTVTFGVSAVQRSILVGPDMVSVPFVPNGSHSITAASGSLVMNHVAQGTKKVTVALNFPLPSGVTLQVHFPSDSVASPTTMLLTTTATEVDAEHEHKNREPLRSIPLQYLARKSSGSVSHSDNTVVFTITE